MGIIKTILAWEAETVFLTLDSFKKIFEDPDLKPNNYFLKEIDLTETPIDASFMLGNTVCVFKSEYKYNMIYTQFKEIYLSAPTEFKDFWNTEYSCSISQENFMEGVECIWEPVAFPDLNIEIPWTLEFNGAKKIIKDYLDSGIFVQNLGPSSVTHKIGKGFRAEFAVDITTQRLFLNVRFLTEVQSDETLIIDSSVSDTSD